MKTKQSTGFTREEALGSILSNTNTLLHGTHACGAEKNRKIIKYSCAQHETVARIYGVVVILRCEIYGDQRLGFSSSRFLYLGFGLFNNSQKRSQKKFRNYFSNHPVLVESVFGLSGFGFLIEIGFISTTKNGGIIEDRK